MLTIPGFLDPPKFVQTWVLAATLAGILVPKTGFASKAARDPDRAILLALDSSSRDDDHRTSPHGDRVLLLNWMN